MTRRPVLPGASELFRRTDTASSIPEVTELPSLSATASSPALRAAPAAEETSAGMPLTLVPGGAAAGGPTTWPPTGPQRRRPTLQPSVPTRGRPVRRTERPGTTRRSPSTSPPTS